ncbi:MAG: DUF898 domain-containing protein [Arcobacter sp.]|nr:DUF898 domain-containing protein [Arcobacter sp.]
MQKLKFEGNSLEYFKIWIVNIFLTIITLGIYYPWAKVRNNRYFYANSNLEENNFEYHATGKQLFLGYMIGVLLFIIYITFSNIFPIYSMGFILALFIAIPWLIWRSMIFNMNVTTFNNIRFKFTGKLKQSYITFLFYPILFMALFGGIMYVLFLIENKIASISGIILLLVSFLLIYAYYKKITTNYLINYTKYGTSSFKTDLETKKFLIINIKTTLLSILCFLLAFLVLALMFYLFNDLSNFDKLVSNFNDQEKINSTIFSMLPFIIAGYIIFIFLNFFIASYYITKTREYIFSNTSLDNEITFKSTINFFKLSFITITNVLVIMLTFGLAIPWSKVRLTRYMLENTKIDTQGDLDRFFNQQNSKHSALGEEIADSFNIDVSIPL